MRVCKKINLWIIVVVVFIIIGGMLTLLLKKLNTKEIENDEVNETKPNNICEYNGYNNIKKYTYRSKCVTYKSDLYALGNQSNNMINGSWYYFDEDEILIIPFYKLEMAKEKNVKTSLGFYDKSYSFVLVTRRYIEDSAVGFNYYVQSLTEEGYGTKLSLLDDVYIEPLFAKELIKIPKGDSLNLKKLSLPSSVLDSLPKKVTKVKIIK